MGQPASIVAVLLINHRCEAVVKRLTSDVQQAILWRQVAFLAMDSNNDQPAWAARVRIDWCARRQHAASEIAANSDREFVAGAGVKAGEFFGRVLRRPVGVTGLSGLFGGAAALGTMMSN